MDEALAGVLGIQGVQGFGEKGHLFSGIWVEVWILGSREQGVEEKHLGSWEQRPPWEGLMDQFIWPYTLWSCQNVCDALSYLLDNTYIRFGTKFYRKIVGTPMGTHCAPLVAGLFLFCYERNFMESLNHANHADVIEAFNSTFRYLDELLNI